VISFEYTDKITDKHANQLLWTAGECCAVLLMDAARRQDTVLRVCVRVYDKPCTHVLQACF
jgi:hypothetical protein